MTSVDEGLAESLEEDTYVEDPDPYETAISFETAFSLDNTASFSAVPRLLHPPSLREACMGCLRRSEASLVALRLQPLLVRRSSAHWYSILQLIQGDVAAAEQIVSEVLAKEEQEESDELDLFLSWEKLSGKPGASFDFSTANSLSWAMWASNVL